MVKKPWTLQSIYLLSILFYIWIPTFKFLNYKNEIHIVLILKSLIRII